MFKTSLSNFHGFPPGACGNDKLFLFSDKLKRAGMTIIISYYYQNIEQALSGYFVTLWFIRYFEINYPVGEEIKESEMNYILVLLISLLALPNPPPMLG